MVRQRGNRSGKLILSGAWPTTFGIRGRQAGVSGTEPPTPVAHYGLIRTQKVSANDAVDASDASEAVTVPVVPLADVPPTVAAPVAAGAPQASWRVVFAGMLSLSATVVMLAAVVLEALIW